VIEIPGQIQAETAGKVRDAGKVSQADAHAMKTLMNREGSAGELSAIFSAQLSRRPCVEKKTGTKLKGLDPVGKDSEKESRDPEEAEFWDASELARQVAEHILVSDPQYLDPGAAGEVRIRVKERIMKDTVILLKDMPDRLKVRMVTGDPGSARILEAAESALVSRLEEHFAGRIDIKTQYRPQEEPHEGS